MLIVILLDDTTIDISKDPVEFHHDLTSRPNPGIMVSKGNYPNMFLIQVSEIL